MLPLNTYGAASRNVVLLPGNTRAGGYLRGAKRGRRAFPLPLAGEGGLRVSEGRVRGGAASQTPSSTPHCVRGIFSGKREKEERPGARNCAHAVGLGSPQPLVLACLIFLASLASSA